ncbi:MAG TPA: alpha/beta hydrolase [Jatrophihabitans sp.]|jgi:pimeloyl-ACP methyl ester carboxylesterase
MKWGRLWIGAAAAGVAAAGTAVAVDRKVRSTRQHADLDEFRPPEPDRAGYVRATDGVRLYYEQDGPADAAITVVLVHGFCLDRDDLLFQRRALIEEFGDRVRVVSVDLRSHGRSSRGDAEHATIDQLATDLRLVLRELVPDGPIVLIGHSMGGMTILALADAQPRMFRRRVAGVALISTSTGKIAWLTLGVPAALVKVGDPALRLAMRGVSRRSNLIERGRTRLGDASWIFVRRLAFGPHPDPGLVEFLTRMIGRTPVDVIAEFFPTLTSHDKLAALDVLVNLPVVIVCGADDLVTPVDHSREMAHRLPGAEFVLVPATGHQALMERPDLVNPPLLRMVGDALERARDVA